jgi:hypothetical protein
MSNADMVIMEGARARCRLPWLEHALLRRCPQSVHHGPATRDRTTAPGLLNVWGSRVPGEADRLGRPVRRSGAPPGASGAPAGGRGGAWLSRDAAGAGRADHTRSQGARTGPTTTSAERELLGRRRRRRGHHGAGWTARACGSLLRPGGVVTIRHMPARTRNRRPWPSWSRAGPGTARLPGRGGNRPQALVRSRRRRRAPDW